MIWMRGCWPDFAALETLDMLEQDDIECVNLDFALSLFATDSAPSGIGCFFPFCPL